MIKPTAKMPFDAAASNFGSPLASTPVHLQRDDAAMERGDQRLPEITEASNSLLIRTDASERRGYRPSVATVVTGGAAVLASTMSSLGCAGQGDIAIGAIVLGWGLATVGAWGGILLGLNWVAGWIEDHRVTPAGIQERIDEGEWYRIENALLDVNRDPKDIASMQATLLESSEKIPLEWQTSIYKAIAIANGDPELAIKGIDHLLDAAVARGYILNALMGIVEAYEQKPHEYIGICVARALINFEWRHKGGIPDHLFARAVALTQYWEDVVIIIGILATRIKLGHVQTNAHLYSAIQHLLKKPFGLEVYHNQLPPFLVDIDGIDPYWGD